MKHPLVARSLVWIVLSLGTIVWGWVGQMRDAVTFGASALTGAATLLLGGLVRRHRERVGK